MSPGGAYGGVAEAAGIYPLRSVTSDTNVRVFSEDVILVPQ